MREAAFIKRDDNWEVVKRTLSMALTAGQRKGAADEVRDENWVAVDHYLQRV
jgi:hypothetical protein